MIISHIRLKNWRNFRTVDHDLGYRMFLFGANASGKSNLLDAFRFLRDIARPDGGGLQNAINLRGGISKIRCLAARADPKVELEVHLADEPGSAPTWQYLLSLKQEPRGYRGTVVAREVVRHAGNPQPLLERPDKNDERDRKRLMQTHLEQIGANQDFRDIADFLASISYMHLVPQMLRHPETVRRPSGDDPFGANFLERLARTPEGRRTRMLKRIEVALQSTVPQLQNLSFKTDPMGAPHLEAIYKHWRPDAGRQSEEEFSDGTLRLIGLLWSLLEQKTLLLLEEPELSLHSAVVTRLPGLFWRTLGKSHVQVLISTHSGEMVSDQSVGPAEVILLEPHAEGTKTTLASDLGDVNSMIEDGMPLGEAVIPRTAPEHVNQLNLFHE
jgi:predicted ATPase